jgi:transposase-like protein
MSEERIPARVVARMIGVKTATLAKWRRFGKGPRGWIEASPTLITYPVEEVAPSRYLPSLLLPRGSLSSLRGGPRSSASYQA